MTITGVMVCLALNGIFTHAYLHYVLTYSVLELSLFTLQRSNTPLSDNVIIQLQQIA